MEIKKIKTNTGTYDIYIKQDNKILKIIYGGNGDLYLIIDNMGKEDFKSIKKLKIDTFTITKENYYIYSVFETLINDIKESKVFMPLDESNIFFSLNSHESEEEWCRRYNEDLKTRSNYQLLYDGKSIIWHSDEDPYDIANILKITKNVDDTITLEFTRKPANDSCDMNYIIPRMPGTISIRIRNSGSTYDPYNIVFMRMYQKLTIYDTKYHQIHIEEFLYQKKKLKKSN